MRLTKFLHALKKNGKPEKSFANLIIPPVSQSHINGIRHGRRQSSCSLSLRIERAAGGAVLAEELPMTDSAWDELQAIRLPGSPDRSHLRWRYGDPSPIDEDENVDEPECRGPLEIGSGGRSE